MSGDRPRYVNQASLARALGVAQSTVASWRTRYPGETPEPSAFYIGPTGREFALWSVGQVEAWRRWAASGG